MRPGVRLSGKALVALVSAMLVVTACSDDGDPPPADNTRTADSADPLDLSGVCPETISIQMPWYPNVAEAALYRLLGEDPEVEAKQNQVSAPLTVDGRDTGVTLELRAGGPAIGFTPASAQLYLDPSITLGIMPTDEQILVAKKQPTIGVLAMFEIDPQIIMWDPETYPEFESIADIGKTDTTVLYFGGDTYMEYLVGAGILKRSQVDGSYDGSPSRFVAEEGAIAQSGFATDGPFTFENEVPEWGKPLKYQLVKDTGYPNYSDVLAIRAGEREQLAPCLERLVPIIQQSQVDFLDDPGTTGDLVVELNEAFKSSSPQTIELFEFGIQQERDLGLVSNGPDDTIGNFDPSRVEEMIEIAGPIFAKEGKDIKKGLGQADLVTNDFIDPAIGLP